MAYLALDPTSAGIYGLLNVSALTSLVSGLSDDITQATTFPYLWFEVHEQDQRGLGTGGLPQVQLRLHVFGQDVQGLQVILQKAIQLLRDQAPTIAGYALCGRVFYDETLSFPDQLINGVKVHELVAQMRIYVEET